MLLPTHPRYSVEDMSNWRANQAAAVWGYTSYLIVISGKTDAMKVNLPG